MIDEVKEEFVTALGALPEVVDVRDYRLEAPVMAQEFPEEFELPKGKIKYQGSVGSCVAHAVAETIEYHNKKQNNFDGEMSVGFIYGNRRNSVNKSSGMYVREALSNTCKYGDVLKSDFSENKEPPKIIELFEERFDSLKDKAYSHRFSTYFRVTSDSDIKYALMNYGPVVFAMDWYSDIKVNLSTGLISTTCDKKKKEGGHCMIIYGWNKDGWKIQNSWGTWWGKTGCAVLPYDIKKSEAWGITDEVTDENPDIVKPIFNTTLLRILAKIINFIANLFKKKG